jgi:purine-binding chemotaxis protein CheW
MSTVGALDDYLDELLGGGMPTAVTATAPAAPVKIPGDSAELEAAFEAALAEVQAQANAVSVDAPVAAASTVPGDSAELEAAFEAALADVQARANAVPVEAPISVVSTVPGDSAELEAAFEAALAAATASRASAMAEPTWADVPAEPVAAAPAPEPTWDDLPDEVIYETDAAESARLAHADSPGLQAAFDVAAGVAPAPPPPARTARPAPAPAPAAPAPAPNTWQELQAQAARPPQQRRASERTSRWLRLRCGAQAYALELLKVQEVVLPVPLLALRGAAPSMLGIMNLRGQVVPVLDLCRHLGVPVTEDSAQTRIVVLEENGETLGLRVSAVEDVANLTDSQIEPPDTARICQISNELFKGIARIGSQPMILLDATRLLQ